MTLQSAHDDLGESPAQQLYRYARELMDGSSFDEAIPLFEASQKLEPHFKAAELLGECYFRQGRLKEAVVQLAAATALNSGHRAPKLLAEVFLEMGELNDAREMAQTAVRRHTHYKEAITLLERIERLLEVSATKN